MLKIMTSGTISENPDGLNHPFFVRTLLSYNASKKYQNGACKSLDIAQPLLMYESKDWPKI